jgi:hypothetical protein
LHGFGIKAVQYDIYLFIFLFFLFDERYPYVLPFHFKWEVGACMIFMSSVSSNYLVIIDLLVLFILFCLVSGAPG